ncbi:MAG: hypothetical protein IPJ84_09200 [Bdellovibrionales bacterium]|nr:hypothetical protein [Bdellovibrionales bacterium]
MPPKAKIILGLLALGVTASLISDRSGYSFPERGRVTLEQARLLTPSSLILDQNESLAFVRSQPINRPGAIDDPPLAALIATQALICVLVLLHIRAAK